MDWQNEKNWYNDRIFETYITQDIVDKQGDRISIDAFKEIMPWFLKFGAIHYKHSSVILGEPIAWKVDGDKIKLKIGVHKKFPVHDGIWKEIKNYGEFGTASIGGQSIISDLKCDSEKCWNDITKLGLWDVSWVGANPANPGAKVDKVAMLAKEWDEPERMRDSLAKELYDKLFNELTDEEKQKVHNVATIAREKTIEQKSGEILQKPFGPWKDWDACMSEMTERYSEEKAKKVCGALKRDLEKEKGEGVKKEMEKEGEQEQKKIAPEEKEKQEVPGEEETVDLKEVLAEIMRRLDALEGKGKAPEEETEEKAAPTTPNEVSVKIKEGEDKEENKESEATDEDKLEKTVEKILEKHKITVTPADKPTQTQEDSSSKVSFNGMLEKARGANNMEDFRNGI